MSISSEYLKMINLAMMGIKIIPLKMDEGELDPSLIILFYIVN